MAQVIQLKDGSLHIVFGEQDILSLVESDNVKARRLDSRGHYNKIQNLSTPIDSQEECIRQASAL